MRHYQKHERGICNSQPASPLKVQKVACSALLIYSSAYASTGGVLEKQKMKTLEMRQNIRQDYE